MQWIEDGAAHEILDGHRREFARRAAAALDAMGPLVARPPNAAATHLWRRWESSRPSARRACAARARAGHAAHRAHAAGALECGLRLCLGGAANIAALQEGLGVVARILAETEEPALEVV